MIDAIIDFMTTLHEGGRHGPVYGWVYVLAVFVSIGSALGTRELLARRKRLLGRTQALAASGPLVAAVVIGEQGDSRLVTGTIRYAEGVYELTLRESSGSTQRESKHAFPSIDRLGQYLESNTVLRLGDFKPG